MERVKGIDAGFLYMETPTVHMHTLKVSVLEPTSSGTYAYDQVKHELDQRLHLLPPFRRRLVSVPYDLHHPVWIEDPDFDIDNHIHRVAVPPPTRLSAGRGGDRQRSRARRSIDAARFGSCGLSKDWKAVISLFWSSSITALRTERRRRICSPMSWRQPLKRSTHRHRRPSGRPKRSRRGFGCCAMRCGTTFAN